MIKVTFGQIRSLNFNPLLARLLQSKMPFHCAKKLVDILHAVRSEQEKSDTIWQAIQHLYLEPIDITDEYSPAKIRDGLTEEDKLVAVEEIKKFISSEIELNVDPLPVEAFEKVELTGEELMLLKGLIA